MTTEYLELWKESGIEGIDHLAPKIARRLLRKPPINSPVQPSQVPEIKSLIEIQAWLGDCKRCGLCKDRNSIVFGTGNPNATVMFIGEGPGADEDAQGLPFVGNAGQLLNKILEAMKYKREDVYIGNIVKCRPPDNRTPEPDEIKACSAFIRAQIEAIQPKVIVALGLTAANTLLGSTSTMSALRGRLQNLTWNPEIPVFSTYHPAYLLRNPEAKKLVWEDMKKVLEYLKK